MESPRHPGGPARGRLGGQPFRTGRRPTQSGLRAASGRPLGEPVPFAEHPAAYGLVTRAGAPYPADRLPFARVFHEGAPVMVDDIVLRRGDRDVSIRAFASPLHDAGGRLTTRDRRLLDISAEVAAQFERQRVEEHLRFACDHSPIAIWTTDAAGVITMSEGAGLAALGVKPGQLVGQKLLDVYGDHPTIPGKSVAASPGSRSGTPSRSARPSTTPGWRRCAGRRARWSG